MKFLKELYLDCALNHFFSISTSICLYLCRFNVK